MAPRQTRLLFVGGIALLSGCALTDLTLRMPAAPLGLDLSGGDGRQIVLASPFADERPARHRCGMKKNGYNMDTADVDCSAEPGPWLANLLAEELRAAGFSVVSAEAVTHAHPLQLQGTLLQLFVEPVIGFASGTIETDLHVRLVASSNDGLLAERDFFVKGAEAASFGIDAHFQGSLDDATHRALHDMVAAILSLMNRYPELGLGPAPSRDEVVSAAKGAG